MNENQSAWPSAAVAIAILTLIGAVTVAAIIEFPTLAEALQFWQAMAALIGIVTGAFVTYFFTRGTVEIARAEARDAKLMADRQERRADLAQQALTMAAGKLPPAEFEALFRDANGRPGMPPTGGNITGPAAGGPRGG